MQCERGITQRANERMCSETGELMSQWSGGSKVSVNGELMSQWSGGSKVSVNGELMSQWSGGSKVSVNGGTTQMVRWKQGQCEWGNNSQMANWKKQFQCAREQGTSQFANKVWKQVQCERGIHHLANERNCSVNRDQKSMGEGKQFQCMHGGQQIDGQMEAMARWKQVQCERGTSQWPMVTSAV